MGPIAHDYRRYTKLMFIFCRVRSSTAYAASCYVLIFEFGAVAEAVFFSPMHVDILIPAVRRWEPVLPTLMLSRRRPFDENSSVGRCRDVEIPVGKNLPVVEYMDCVLPKKYQRALRLKGHQHSMNRIFFYSWLNVVT